MNRNDEEMKLREDFKPYFNPMGLVDDERAKRGENSGNSLLFHAHYLWALKAAGFYDFVDGVLAVRAIKRHCEIVPGNYRRAGVRFSFWNDQQGPDDFIGLASLSALDSRIPFAADILWYGRTVRVALSTAWVEAKAPWWGKLFGGLKLSFVFNTNALNSLRHRDGDRPDFGAWLGRFPQFRAHLKFCNREKKERPNLVERIAWALSVWQTARFFDKAGTDQWILSRYLVIGFECSGQKSLMCKLAARNFWKRLDARGGIRALFAPYFGESHPITVHSVDKPHDASTR